MDNSIFKPEQSNPDQPNWDLDSIFRKLKLATENAENFSDKFTQAELKGLSSKSADVILKNDDFGYGVKKERLANIFKEAANKGPEAIKQLTLAINKELESRNSSLRLEGHYDVQTDIIDKASYPKHGEDVYVYPQFYKDKYAGGSFTLRDQSKNTVEDQMSVRGNFLSSDYLGNQKPGDSLFPTVPGLLKMLEFRDPIDFSREKKK